MILHHVYYQLAILGLLWFCIMLHSLWPSRGAVAPAPPAKPVPPTCKRKRSKELKPFAGLTQRPHCAACAHDANHPTPPSPRRPAPIPPTNRRPRVIDTSRHFCPHAGCDYQGWPGLGNLRANGHPSGGPWRQFHCTSCGGYVLETHGTLFHGKRASVDLIVRVIACLAEGLGIRATARVFEVDPNTVLHGLVEAAEQLQAFTSFFLCDVHVTQLQLDELYAALRSVRDGEISEDQALKRLEPTRPWVWTCQMDTFFRLGWGWSHNRGMFGIRVHVVQDMNPYPEHTPVRRWAWRQALLHPRIARGLVLLSPFVGWGCRSADRWRPHTGTEHDARGRPSAQGRQGPRAKGAGMAERESTPRHADAPGTSPPAQSEDCDAGQAHPHGHETGHESRPPGQELPAQGTAVAAEATAQGREYVRAWHTQLEQRVREQPLQSLLLAAGLACCWGSSGGVNQVSQNETPLSF